MNGGNQQTPLTRPVFTFLGGALVSAVVLIGGLSWSAEVALRRKREQQELARS